MTQINYSTKHIKNKHLTIKERAQIELLVKQGTKKSEIARSCLKNKSCTKKRNRVNYKYGT
jgi:IS30 family transposase